MTRDEIFDRIMEYEGGGQTHTVPGDPGGTTKWGVSARAYPHIDIPNLDRETAFRIWENDYFKRIRGDQLPEELRLPMGDLAYNVGTGRAGILLQQSINLCLQSVGRGDFLKLDGMIGPRTLGTIDIVPPDRLANVLLAYRMEYYTTLAETGRAKFIHGWLRRAKEVHS